LASTTEGAPGTSAHLKLEKNRESPLKTTSRDSARRGSTYNGFHRRRAQA
ncbi:hypothetical protein A2U01_0086048, partial [Trifolium medium]|nr:hypothetical protein [Trifolium medium]